MVRRSPKTLTYWMFPGFAGVSEFGSGTICTYPSAGSIQQVEKYCMYVLYMGTELPPFTIPENTLNNRQAAGGLGNRKGTNLYTPCIRGQQRETRYLLGSPNCEGLGITNSFLWTCFSCRCKWAALAGGADAGVQG